MSLLVRCCDVSSKCQSAVEGKAVLPNPYLDASCPPASSSSASPAATSAGDASSSHHVPLYPLQPAIAALVFDRYRDDGLPCGWMFQNSEFALNRLTDFSIDFKILVVQDG